MSTWTLTDEECREAVREALESLPPQFASQLQNVAVIIEDRDPERPGLMGLYDPRGGLQRIVIYREANPTREEVTRTVLHEVGHHFGMSEGQIRGLGF
jgi:predicted Zn-dependent protease with MMP-like domain